MKAIIIFEVVMFVFLVEARVKTHLKSAKGYSVDKSSASVHSCYAKSYARNSSVLFLDLTFHKPIYKPVYVNFRSLRGRSFIS